jgi:hypothetical protein
MRGSELTPMGLNDVPIFFFEIPGIGREFGIDAESPELADEATGVFLNAA